MKTRPIPCKMVWETLSTVCIDEVRAVDIGHDPHIVGLQTLVELGDLGVDAFQNP